MIFCKTPIVTAARNNMETAIVGADSFIGSALANAFKAAGRTVYDIPSDSDRFDIPPECGFVFFCHDVSLERDFHIRVFSALCQYLSSTHSTGNQVHLCYFSTANICDGGGRQIGEAATVYPHNLRELAVCQAEMMLKAWVSMSRGAIVPNVFRHGELYGEADMPHTNAGHVNECLRLARDGKPLSFYGNLNQKRTLLHVNDLADSVITLLSKEIIPNLINVPGETLSIYDYLAAISEHYGVELNIGTGRSDDDNLPPYSCDRVLSSSLFRSEIDFKPKHRFKKWLNLQ